MSNLSIRIKDTPTWGLLEMYSDTYSNATADCWLEDDFYEEIPDGEHGMKLLTPQAYARRLIREEIDRRCKW